MAKVKKKPVKEKAVRNFPIGSIYASIESPENSFILLADQSDKAKEDAVGVFSTEGAKLYKEFEMNVKALAKRLGVNSITKVFLILE